MQLPTITDTRSPWYEAFTPQTVPSAWVLAAPNDLTPEAGQPDQPDDRWATDALFDYYNE